jgi:FkbH-like protein
LDYFALAKKARRLGPVTGQRLRIAFLADVSTQHLAPVLRVLGLLESKGTDFEIYEAGFDTIQLEVYDAESRLYTVAPDFVVILQGATKLKELYYAFSGDRQLFVGQQANEIENVWKTVLARIQVPILQSTFVVPCERAWGNLSVKVLESLQSCVLELNREICLRSRRYASVFINDIDYLAAWSGREHFLNERLWALSKSICSLELLPQLAQNILDIVLACRGRAVKCLVLDLDNTLWGGVVGDDGLEGIGLGELDDGGCFRLFQLFLRELSRRGILLAVCSKNDEALARRVFREHQGMVLKEEDIAVFVANWEDKAANIIRIREKLNIGFDSMVFVDDSAFERNLVRKLIPDVIVPELPPDPALYARTLSELNLFEAVSQSTLDAQRTSLYQAQEKREMESRRFNNITEYLQSLETTALCQPFLPGTISRVAQLIQRSNQFNLTTRRYSEAQCEAMMRDSERYATLTLSISDRFGDFGLVTVVILRKLADGLEIDTFLMSCRVLQRGVEQHAMNKLFELARSGRHTHVIGRFIPTAKNAMVREFYSGFGFKHLESGEGGETVWSLGTADYLPRKVFIRDS